MVFCSACGAALPHGPPVGCGSCGARHWLDAKPCAGAALARDGRLLLVRRAHEPWRGRWDVPGGFCDPGEHPIETAERELREETGVRVRVTGFLGIWLDEYRAGRAGSPPKPTLNIYYHAVPVGGPAAAPDPREVAELGWFGPGELPSEVAFPGHVPRVLAAWRLALRAGQLRSPLLDRRERRA